MKLTPEQIKEFSQGNVKIFNEIYDRMFHSLCLFGYKMIPEEDVVSDVVQEIFIQLWKKRAQFNDPLKLRSYLYTSVRNNILTQIRNKKTISIETNPQEEEVVFNNHIAAEETYRLIHEAVASLPEQTGKIIGLAINGYGNPEIADSLNISVNTVKTLKKSAYVKLREKLKNNVFELVLLAQIIS